MAEQTSLVTALSDVKESEVLCLVDEKLNAGEPATDVLAECREGMAVVGRRFEAGEYFIPELIFAGTIMKQVMNKLQPLLEEAPEAEAGGKTVVIGTVRDDIHDIGKDVVTMMLQGTGFRVIDLGVNVPPQRFVDATKDNRASVVGMSVFLTSCCKFISETVDALKHAGLRDGVSVMIGGAAASKMVAERTGCDAYGETAVDAVSLAVTFAKG